jgi:hypothetical protein
LARAARNRSIVGAGDTRAGCQHKQRNQSERNSHVSLTVALSGASHGGVYYSLMTEPVPVEQRGRGKPRRPAGLGIGPALGLTITSVIVCIGTTVALLRGDYSTLVDEILAAAALISFGFAIYGMLRMVLALIETAGERRRKAREITERRKAEREQPPE